MEWQHAAAFPDAAVHNLKYQVEMGLNLIQDAMLAILQSRQDQCTCELRVLGEHINQLIESTSFVKEAHEIIVENLSSGLQSDTSALFGAYRYCREAARCCREAADAVLSPDEDVIKNVLADPVTCTSFGLLCVDPDTQIHDFVDTVLDNMLYFYEMTLNAQGMTFDYEGFKLSEEFARRKRLAQTSIAELLTEELTEITEVAAYIRHAQWLLDYGDACAIVQAKSALTRANLAANYKMIFSIAWTTDWPRALQNDLIKMGISSEAMLHAIGTDDQIFRITLRNSVPQVDPRPDQWSFPLQVLQLQATTCPSTVDTLMINEACKRVQELLVVQCLHDVPQHLRSSPDECRNEFLARVKDASGGIISEDEKSRVLNAACKLPKELRFFESESARQGRASRPPKRSKDAPLPPGLVHRSGD